MLLIRSATIADASAIGHVHFVSWMETYRGLIDEEYLQSRTEEKSVEMFRQNECRNTLVAEVDGTIVGFLAYGPSRDEDLPDAGEIIALYLLKGYQRKGVGKRLLDFAIRIMQDSRRFSLWVLESNQNAILFYRKNGFVFDGITKMQRAGETYLRETRMVKILDEPKRRRRPS